jgi:hypothetical protein
LSSIKWLDTGFGLATGFIGLLQIVTTDNYSASLINTHYNYALSLLSLLCFTSRCVVTAPTS